MKLAVLATIFGAVAAFAPPSQSGRFASPPMCMQDGPVSIQSKSFGKMLQRCELSGDRWCPRKNSTFCRRPTGLSRLSRRLTPAPHGRQWSVTAGKNGPGGVVSCRRGSLVRRKIQLPAAGRQDCRDSVEGVPQRVPPHRWQWCDCRRKWSRRRGELPGVRCPLGKFFISGA